MFRIFGRSDDGFSLLELLIVLAIVSIVLSSAIPGYSNTVIKTRRKDAELALQSLALAMRRHYAQRFSFRGAASGGADTGPPAIYPQFVPLDGGVRFYRLSITHADDTEFELSAIPVEPHEDVVCGELKLNSLGRRGSHNNAGRCWNGTLAYQALGD